MPNITELLETVVLPVESPKSAELVCEEAIPYVRDAGGRVVSVFVVEETPQSPPIDLTEETDAQAKAVFDVVEKRCRDADVPVETHVLRGSDEPQSILDAAEDAGATAVVYVLREENRWVKLLTGDTLMKLITENHLPVLVLPSDEPTA